MSPLDEKAGARSMVGDRPRTPERDDALSSRPVLSSAPTRTEPIPGEAIAAVAGGS